MPGFCCIPLTYDSVCKYHIWCLSASDSNILWVLVISIKKNPCLVNEGFFRKLYKKGGEFLDKFLICCSRLFPQNILKPLCITLLYCFRRCDPGIRSDSRKPSEELSADCHLCPHPEHGIGHRADIHFSAEPVQYHTDEAFRELHGYHALLPGEHTEGLVRIGGHVDL